MKQDLFIGIDGGGTRSTAVAAWPNGQVAAISCGKGLNFHNIGVEKVRTRLEGLVQDLCAKADAPVGRVCVGMSALDGPADENTLSRFAQGIFTPENLDLQSDAYIALMGFTRGQPGMIVICGTGSMLLLVDSKGTQHVSGGWGYLLGDAGSGYTLAREGVLAVIDAFEGTGDETAMTQQMCAFFGVSSPREIIEHVYAPDFTPDRLAGFARYVLGCVEAGDEAACAILHKNMKRLARQASLLIEKSPEATQVGLYGGIFAHSEEARSAFANTLHALTPGAQICSLDYPPELGAIIHLMLQQGCLNEESLLRLKTSYEICRKENGL